MLDSENKSEMAALTNLLSTSRQIGYINGRASRLELIMLATSLERAQEIVREASYQDDVRTQNDTLADAEPAGVT